MPSPSVLGRRAGTAWRTLLREVSAFGVVGGACVVVDLGVFQLLYVHLGVGAVTARLMSAAVSTTLAYVGHRFWSFAHRERSGYRREYGLFVLLNGLTVSLGLALVALVHHPLGQDSSLVLQATNVVSIGLGTVIRWFAYRRWVFRAGPGRVTGPVPAPASPRRGRPGGGAEPATTGS